MAEQTEVASGYVSLYARLESSQVANEVSNALSKAFSGSAISDALSGFSSFSTKAGAALTAGLAVAAHKGMDVVGDLLNTISTTESAVRLRTSSQKSTSAGSTTLQSRRRSASSPR